MNDAVRGKVPASHTSCEAHLSRRAMLRGGVALAAALAGLARPGAIPVLAGSRHLVIDLGPGGEGGDWSNATAVNGAGQLVLTWGTAIDADAGTISDPHPCVWEAGAVRDFSLLGLRDIRGISSNGTVLGSTGPQAVRVLPDTDFVEPLTGFTKDAYATAISPAGLIAGTIAGSPVILNWDQVFSLPLPDGFGYFSPSALTDAGQTAGTARIERANDAGQRAAVVTPEGEETILAPAPGGEDSAAAGINASGHVAGGPATRGMRNVRQSGRAFRHDLATGETLDLGVLPGYANSCATGIDSAGRVIGTCWEANPENPFQSAWIWDEASGMVDLNSLIPEGAGWLLSDAHGINDAGWIVGQGGYMGQRRGYLLVPVETA